MRTTIAFALIAALAACGPTPDIPTGSDLVPFEVKQANTRNTPVVITPADGPVREGVQALRFSVGPGQCAGNVSFDDCGNGRARSELVEAAPPPTGVERWYAVSFFVPTETAALGPSPTTLVQWQDTRGSGEITLGLSLWPEGIELVQDDPTTQQTDDNDPPRPMTIRTVLPDAALRGRWHDLRVRAIWSAGADGLLTVWLNDRQVLRHEGRNLNRDVAPTFKFGVYQSGLGRLSGEPPVQVVFFDAIRRGATAESVAVE
ncbi:MAG: polysaccharide lyase [Pseudomonadota bacterium]